MNVRFAAIAMGFALLSSGALAAPPRGSAAYDARVRAGKAPAYFDRTNLGREPVLSASSALLMDASSGQVLWARNADARRFPASTTKILTGLLFAEASRPEDRVTCRNPRIGDIGESSLNVKPGESFSADDLLKGMLLRSANDGAVVIAEHVAGSSTAFADLMNARAKRIGATRSHFTNPHGLHDPAHFTTARDLALIAREALKNTRFKAIVRNPVATIRRTASTDRRLVAKAKHLFYDKVPGADGVKTGYTRPAGNCFVGSATRGGRRLIAVVLGAKRSACTETIPLIEWGFRRFRGRTLAREGEVVGNVEVIDGLEPRVSARTAAPVSISWDRLERMPEIRAAIHPGRPKAPIHVGDPVGIYEVVIGDKVAASVPLLATTDLRATPPHRNGYALPASVLGGGIGLGLLVRWRHGRRRYRGAFAQSARRRRRRVPTDRGGVDRGGQGRR